MADKRYYWLKLQDGFFDSKRIKKLRKLAGGDTYTIIYLKMQLVAMKKGGVLEYTGLENTFAEELALELDEEPGNVSVTVNYLLSCGLLEETSQSEYFVPYAVMNTGSESTSTRRVREHRERKTLQCNADETPVKQLCNTEKEIESEIESEIEGEIIEAADEPPTPPAPPEEKGKKGRKKSEIVQPVADYSGTDFSDSMIAVVEKWLKYKAERRDAYKPTGLQSLISKIQNETRIHGEQAVIKVITDSMASNYQGIVWDRLNQQASRRGGNGQNDNLFLQMRDERRGRG